MIRVSGSLAAWIILGLSGWATPEGVARRSAGADAAGPAPRWTQAGSTHGRPVADRSAVYVLSSAHEVSAVATRTGRLLWKAVTGEPGEQTQGATAVLLSSLVVVGDYNIVALNRADGAVRWRFTPAEGYGPGMFLGNTDGRDVYAGSPSAHLYAVNGATGGLRWVAPIARGGQTTVFAPLVDADLVAAGYSTFTAPAVGGLVVVDRETGRERWRAAFPRTQSAAAGGWAGGPVAFEDVLIATSGDGVIHAFDRVTGVVRWSLPPVEARSGGKPLDRDFRALTRSGSILLAGSLGGTVIAYDLRTTRERWRFSSEPDGSVSFQLASDGRSVYVPYLSGRLVAIAVASGIERWRVGSGDARVDWPPALANRRVYAVTSGSLVALDR